MVDATVRRRPFLTWAFASDAGHQTAAEGRLLRDLRANADLVVEGKTVVGGIPGGHASAHFALPGDADIGTGLPNWLSAACEAGVRRALVVGYEHDAEMRSQLHAIDELVVAVPRTDPSRALQVVHSDLIPAGFELVELAADADSLTIRMRRVM
ncbi:hypothetical protein AB0C01_07015 [Micromonospora sp. NPDC048905]|uniref:hypothetical protein n=1 Tax=Micromonospora sp. NPDC048905 TaxID=3155494 RepID=UPI0033EEB33F